MRSLLRQILSNKHVLALLAQGLTAVFGFAGFLVLIRLLSPEAFGGWVLYLTAGTFLDMFRSGLVQTAMVRFASTSDAAVRQRVLGAGWVLGLGLTLALMVIVVGVGLIVSSLDDSTAFAPFFAWWPWLALACLPIQFATWTQQAAQRFGRIVILRVVVTGAFALIVLASWLWLPLDLNAILAVHVGVNVLASALAVATRWAPIRAFAHADKATIRTLFHFGKYSVGTLLGTNLLRSADTFILSAVLGPAAVAFYAVSQKLVEATEVPLRGFAMVAYPDMSRLCLQDKVQAMRHLFNRSVGALTLVLIPVLVAGWVWADDLVVLIGGEAYRDAGGLLRVFLLYALLLPLDRYLGLALDSLGKPHLNLIKVSLMVVVNVVGDGLALLLVGTVEAVAVVTVAMTLVGVVLGLVFINRSFVVRLSDLVREGWVQCRDLILQGLLVLRRFRREGLPTQRKHVLP